MVFSIVVENFECTNFLVTITNSIYLLIQSKQYSFFDKLIIWKSFIFTNGICLFI